MIGDVACVIKAVSTAPLDVAAPGSDVLDPRLVVLVHYAIDVGGSGRAAAVYLSLVDSHGVTVQPRPMHRSARGDASPPQHGAIERVFVLAESRVRPGFELVLSEQPAATGRSARFGFELGR